MFRLKIFSVNNLVIYLCKMSVIENFQFKIIKLNYLYNKPTIVFEFI